MDQDIKKPHSKCEGDQVEINARLGQFKAVSNKEVKNL